MHSTPGIESRLLPDQKRGKLQVAMSSLKDQGCHPSAECYAQIFWFQKEKIYQAVHLPVVLSSWRKFSSDKNFQLELYELFLSFNPSLDYFHKMLTTLQHIYILATISEDLLWPPLMACWAIFRWVIGTSGTLTSILTHSLPISILLEGTWDRMNENLWRTLNGKSYRRAYLTFYCDL